MRRLRFFISDYSALILQKLDINRGSLAAFVLQFVGYLLAIGQALQAGALNGRNMYEDVVAAFGGLDKSKTLSGIEPFYCTFGHDALLGRKLISRRELSPLTRQSCISVAAGETKDLRRGPETFKSL